MSPSVLLTSHWTFHGAFTDVRLIHSAHSGRNFDREKGRVWASLPGPTGPGRHRRSMRPHRLRPPAPSERTDITSFLGLSARWCHPPLH
jgi:hypothetical protein